MSETNSRKCKQCGKEVVVTDTGVVVHVGGGSSHQRCRNCGWTGGQAGGYVTCPRCGDQTNLYSEHHAS